MSALLIGFLVVAGSAALFGVALFGRRPIPQSATTEPRVRRASQSSQHLVGQGNARPAVMTAPAATIRSADVRIPTAVRVRSAILLLVSALGMALLVGTVLSILVVGFVFLFA